MKFVITALVSTVILFLGLTPGLAAEKTIFGTFRIPFMVVDEKQGLFIELVTEIGKKSGLDIYLEVTSPKRATAGFKNGKTDVLFPAIETLTRDPRFLRSREIFYIRKDFAFTLKGGPLISTMSGLEGKKVGITRGYRYSRTFLENTGIQFDLANGDDLNIRKLFAGRIDVFVVEEKSGLMAFEAAGKADAVQYDPLSPVNQEEIFFAFHNTPEGRGLEYRISETLKAMKEDGSFYRIMKRAF